MTQSDFPRRALRIMLSVALLIVAVAGVVVVAVVRAGRGLVLETAPEHRVAYAWVITTVIAAVTAYALAGGAGERPRAGFGRALVVAGLSDAAALAGVLAYFFVPVWPILAISALVALLGLVLAWPRPEVSRDPAAAAAPPADGAPGIDADPAEKAGSAPPGG